MWGWIAPSIIMAILFSLASGRVSKAYWPHSFAIPTVVSSCLLRSGEWWVTQRLLSIRKTSGVGERRPNRQDGQGDGRNAPGAATKWAAIRPPRSLGRGILCQKADPVNHSSEQEYAAHPAPS